MYGYVNKDELYHYGVMGMKWGVRKRPARQITLAGRAHRAYARTFDTNQRYYMKKSAKKASKRNRLNTMAGMNRLAKERTLKRAEESRGLGKAVRKALAKNYEINQNYYSRKANRVDRNVQRLSTMAKLNQNAKNEQLRKAEQADKKKKRR